MIPGLEYDSTEEMRQNGVWHHVAFYSCRSMRFALIPVQKRFSAMIQEGTGARTRKNVITGTVTIVELGNGPLRWLYISPSS